MKRIFAVEEASALVVKVKTTVMIVLGILPAEAVAADGLAAEVDSMIVHRSLAVVSMVAEDRIGAADEDLPFAEDVVAEVVGAYY